MMGHQRLLRSTAISARTAPAKSTAAKRAPKRTMKPKTRPRPGFHGVIGTPLYSWMKLTHSSNTYAAMTPVVTRLLARAVPNCDIDPRPAARDEPEIKLSTRPDHFTFSVPYRSARHWSLHKPADPHIRV